MIAKTDDTEGRDGHFGEKKGRIFPDGKWAICVDLK